MIAIMSLYLSASHSGFFILRLKHTFLRITGNITGHCVDRLQSYVASNKFNWKCYFSLNRNKWFDKIVEENVLSLSFFILWSVIYFLLGASFNYSDSK